MAGYTKLFSSILDSTVWQTPKHTRIVWIAMLAMADRDGIVEASVPGLAIRAGVERAECEQALETLLAPDPDSRSKVADGRRIEVVDGGWRLVNFEHYREKLGAEERREKAAERQRRKRERDAERGAASRDMSRSVTPVTDCHVGHASSRQSEAAPAPAPAPSESERATAAEWTRPKGLTAIGETIRQAVVEHHEARRLPPPSETRSLTHPRWTEIAAWLVDAARLRKWDDDIHQRARALVAAFYASTDPRTVQAKHAIAYLAKNPAQYVGLEAA